jgi:hypothetical protein
MYRLSRNRSPGGDPVVVQCGTHSLFTRREQHGLTGRVRQTAQAQTLSRRPTGSHSDSTFLMVWIGAVLAAVAMTKPKPRLQARHFECAGVEVHLAS